MNEMGWKKKGFFYIVMLVLIPLFCEGLFQLTGLFVPGFLTLTPLERKSPRKINDPKLGNRPDPSFPEHDQKGYRNKRVPEQSEIVALGDSQTYGTRVEPGAAWPHQLSRRLGQSVYNMGFGGWGPVHYVLLLDEALRFQPEYVIVAVYAGNDLYNAFQLVYKQGNQQTLKTEDNSVQQKIRQLEENEPIKQRIQRETRRIGWGWKKPEGLRRFLHKYVKLYALWRKFRAFTARISSHSNTEDASNEQEKPVQQNRTKWEIKKRIAGNHPGMFPFRKGEHKTTFTPDYRKLALNLSDPRITEGLQITKRVLDAMKHRVEKEEAKLIVLFIPTKELAFRPLVNRKKDALPESYYQLVRFERKMWQHLGEFCKKRKIQTVSALPSLRNAIRDGEQPYRLDHDGHPTRAGQRAIAEAVEAYLTDREAKKSQ